MDEIFNRNDLVYRYKGKSSDKKLDEYDNALYLINKIRNGKIKIFDAKNGQINFKSHLGEIKRGSKNSKE